MGTAAALGDRMAQMEAMDGQARCLEELRVQGRICNCRPLEFNTRLLEVASSVGAKLLVRKIRARLALIYRSLGDEEQCKAHLRLATQADLALGLHCGACDEVFGIEHNALEVLSCSHILHARCARNLYRRRNKDVATADGGGGRSCPACNKLVASRSRLCETDDDDEEEYAKQMLNALAILADSQQSGGGGGQTNNGAVFTPRMAATLGSRSAAPPPRPPHRAGSVGGLTAATRSLHRSNLSLASLNLRASSLTINSECHATSSV